jgi:putative ATPase
VKNPLSPLPNRLRPQTLDDVLGQEHIIGAKSSLRHIIENKLPLPSLIFWGPPGTGKTSLAHVLAHSLQANIVYLSGVLDGVAELRSEIKTAEKIRDEKGIQTVAIVDEIHRFNRAQQDAFLPHVESGLLTIIGMTTDNVSFRLRGALLSRLRVFEVKPLLPEHLEILLQRAMNDKDNGFGGKGFILEPDAQKMMIQIAGGDARRALTALEWSVHGAEANQQKEITKEIVEQAFGNQPHLFDQAGDQHYDCISAFIKSMRGSDPDAALYYLVRALESGEDPHFLTRRMIIFASEDCSADPRALEIAVNVDLAVERIGMPEGKISMAQAAVYLAVCAKSNASYKALTAMQGIIAEHPNLDIPKRLRNSPTELMKELGMHKGYKYPHDFPGAFVPERYLPEALGNLRVYQPTDRGIDLKIRDKLAELEKQIAQARKPENAPATTASNQSHPPVQNEAKQANAKGSDQFTNKK